MTPAKFFGPWCPQGTHESFSKHSKKGFCSTFLFLESKSLKFTSKWNFSNFSAFGDNFFGSGK
jgi:hypothetical protein